MLAQRVKKNALNTIVVPTVWYAKNSSFQADFFLIEGNRNGHFSSFQVMSRVAGKNYKEELVAMAMGVGEFYLRCIPWMVELSLY